MSMIKDPHSSVDNDTFSIAKTSDYVTLLKLRVMSLVVFTAFVGLMVAPGHINPILGFLAIICIAVGGGASGALNMWYDSDIDALMKRTQSRPIPSGKISRQQVLIFGLLLSAFSVGVMGVFINWFTALFLAFTIFFYVVIYTIWLKRSTPQNIVIGGASGAFPPMIGWAAVTGSISIDSIVLFLIIFMWTPPHFWALSLFATTDYEAAHIPMMPNVKGERSTKNQILVYAILMAIIGILPFFLGFAGVAFGVISSILGIIFIVRAWQLWKMQTRENTVLAAKKLFFFSLIYLTGVFAILLLENLVVKGLSFWGVI